MTTFKKIISIVLVVTLFASMAVMLSSCNKGKEKEHTHTFYNPWLSDDENHWHAPSCNHKEEKGSLAPHEDSNKDNKCDVCDHEMKSNGGTNQNNTNQTVKYTVYVKDANGQPVANVKVRLVTDNSYTVTRESTDENGMVVFEILGTDWQAALAEEVPGYSNTTEQKYSFDANNVVTIVLQ